jgi:hypothetical protein
LGDAVGIVAACGKGPAAPTLGDCAAETPGGGLDIFAPLSENRDAAYGKPIVTPNSMATINSRDIVLSRCVVTPVVGYRVRSERQCGGGRISP